MSSVYETYLGRYLNDNGKLWSSGQIERWALRAEQEICRVAPAVIRRGQLPISFQVALYHLPYEDGAISFGVNQITYRGEVVRALSLQQAHDLFPYAVIADPTEVTVGAFAMPAFQQDAFFTSRLDSIMPLDNATGKPEFWWYSGYNEKIIQLYPTPIEDIMYDISEPDLWGDQIPNYCVVEYRSPSFGTNKPLARLVRMLIRDYVLSQAFAIEGKGQQLRESVMLKKRFENRLNLYKALSHNVFVANKHSLGNQSGNYTQPFHGLNFGADIGIRLHR